MWRRQAVQAGSAFGDNRSSHVGIAKVKEIKFKKYQSHLDQFWQFIPGFADFPSAIKPQKTFLTLAMRSPNIPEQHFACEEEEEQRRPAGVRRQQERSAATPAALRSWRLLLLALPTSLASSNFSLELARRHSLRPTSPSNSRENNALPHTIPEIVPLVNLPTPEPPNNISWKHVIQINDKGCIILHCCQPRIYYPAWYQTQDESRINILVCSKSLLLLLGVPVSAITNLQCKGLQGVWCTSDGCHQKMRLDGSPHSFDLSLSHRNRHTIQLKVDCGNWSLSIMLPWDRSILAFDVGTNTKTGVPVISIEPSVNEGKTLVQKSNLLPRTLALLWSICTHKLWD